MDYVKRLGYEPSREQGIDGKREVRCVYCGYLGRREGSVMRGHRRRCEVVAWDPFTPGVCDS